MEYVLTKRGQRALIFGGRSFRMKEVYKNGNRRWLCRSRQCNGSLIMSSDENVILKEQGHSCEPDEIKMAMEKIKDHGLKRCREEMTPIPTIHKEIIASAVDQGLDLVVKLPKLSSIGKSMYRNRRKTNISGPGTKLKNVDVNKPSTSTPEEVLPDAGVYQGHVPPDVALPSTVLEYDPSIIIKQEIIETEEDSSDILDASAFGIVPSEKEHIKTSNMPESINGPITKPLSISEDIVGKSLSEVEVTAPISSVGVGVTECNSTTPVKSSKRHNKTDLRKTFVKKNSRRLPNPSGSSSEDEGRRRYRRDKFDAYGDFIASKLRDLDPRSCAFVQTAIADLIFEAELGRFLSEGDKSIFASKTQELLKDMPPPCENES